MISLHIKAGVLAVLFAAPAAAEVSPPVLFEPSDNPFMHTVHGCTSDGALMEVKFGFEFSPEFAQEHLGNDEQLAGVIGVINEHVENSISVAWKNILAPLEFSAIENGEAKPLQPLLEDLYQFTDVDFNELMGLNGGENILPVLRGGAFKTDSSLCMPNL